MIMLPNNIAHAVYVIIACYSTLEMIYKKHVFLTYEKNPSAFTVDLFAG